MKTRWLALLSCLLHPVVRGGEIELPEVLDPELRVELFASEPDIVTPVSIDVDSRGRVWVIESHTHFPPADYPGPATDRVLVLEDTDGDGRSDRKRVFAEGFTHLMGMRLLSERAVLVATRREVFLLDDRDGDVVSDRRRSLARLDTKGDYPHNGLAGFAVDDLDNVYFGLGENLGEPYSLLGSDGTTLSGGGEGGRVYRMRPDGSGLVQWATGFWNPFHLAFDAFGNLFVVDNDADSRPPCRLLDIVREGDYGYRFWLGRKGLHPFQSWNGELPGTLPMVSGTGEAPSGIVAYEHVGLPKRYHGSLLVTSWGDHRLEVHRHALRGATFTARVDTIVRGGEMFRPVGVAVAPDGSVFFSDWADKEYHVHRKGRIWRLRRRRELVHTGADDIVGRLGDPVRAVRERAVEDVLRGSDPARRARELLEECGSDRCRYHAVVVLARAGALDWTTVEALVDAETSAVVEAAAVRLLGETRGVTVDQLGELARRASPRALVEGLLRLAGESVVPVRLVTEILGRGEPFLHGGLLAALAPDGRRQGRVDVGTLVASEDPRHRLLALLVLRRLGERQGLARFLVDEDPEVRRAALQWAGEERIEEHRGAIDRVLGSATLTRELLDAALAAMHLLDDGSPKGRDTQGRDEFLLAVCTDTARPIGLRSMALRSLSPRFPGLTLTVLQELLSATDGTLRLEAVRTVRERGESGVGSRLLAMAGDRSVEVALRREAIVGLSRFPAEGRAGLLALLGDADPRVRAEAARSLRGVELVGTSRDKRDALLEPTLAGRLDDTDALRTGLLHSIDSGDATEGAVLFYHPRVAGCARCHTMHGRGGAVGPDLSTIGRRPVGQILDSLLAPGKEIAPQYATWTVITKTGVHTGIFLDGDGSGTLRLGTVEGEILRIALDDIVSKTLQKSSIMPAELVGELTFAETVDLLAFLRSAR